MPEELPKRKRAVDIPEPLPGPEGVRVPALLPGMELSLEKPLPTRIDRVPSVMPRVPVQPTPQPTPEPEGPTLQEQLQSLKDLFTEQGGDQDTMTLLSAASDKLLQALGDQVPGAAPGAVPDSGLVFDPSDPAKSAGAQAQKTLQQVLVSEWNRRPKAVSIEEVTANKGELKDFVAIYGAYVAEYNVWLNAATNTLKVQTEAATSRLDTVAGFLSNVLQSGSTVKLEKLRQTGNLASQLISMRQEFQNQKGMTKLQTDEAIRLAREQSTLNNERLAMEQDFLRAQGALDRAIELVKLDEVVRHNRGLERLEGERVKLQGRQDSMNFLGNLLANGGLSMFTLAMLSPEAAKASISNAFGGQPGDFRVTTGGESPIDVAGRLRTQQDVFGELQIPSAQQLVQSSPSMRAFQQRAFELEGRDFSGEVGRLIPSSTAGVPRRRRA